MRKPVAILNGNQQSLVVFVNDGERRHCAELSSTSDDGIAGRCALLKSDEVYGEVLLVLPDVAEPEGVGELPDGVLRLTTEVDAFFCSVTEREDDHELRGFPFLHFTEPVGVDQAISLRSESAAKHRRLGHWQVVGNLCPGVNTTFANSAIGADFFVCCDVASEVDDFIRFTIFLLDSGRDMGRIREEEFDDNVFPCQFGCRGSDDCWDCMWLNLTLHLRVFSIC